MTVHRLLPSEIDPARLEDLVEDCRRLPEAVRPRGTGWTAPRPDLSAAPLVRIPDQAERAVSGYAEYGS